MNDKATRPEIEALGLILDVYGADRTRWPASERLRFANLIASDPEAQSLMAEAAAFDRLLDLAPEPSFDRRTAAVERIVTAATKTHGTSVLQMRRLRLPRAAPAANWGAPALLAASLMLGVFAGLGGYSPYTFNEPGVEASLEAEADPSYLALDDSGAATEEDLL